MGLNMDKNRVLFVTDSSNLFYSVRDHYGGKARVDFSKLINYAKYISPRERSLFIPVSYLFQRGDGDKSDLINYLERSSYEVIFKRIESDKSFVVDDTIKDLELDVKSRIDKGGFGTIIFATCQRKLSPFLSHLFSKGFNIQVMSFGGVWLNNLDIPYHTLTSDMVFTGK